jgi:hypothetical protein
MNATDENLVELVLALHEEESDAREPKIICSLGIAPETGIS